MYYFSCNIRIAENSLSEKWTNLREVIFSMMKANTQRSHACTKILSYPGWTITADELKIYGLDDPDFINNNDPIFFQKYLKLRLLLLKENEPNFVIKFFKNLWIK